MQSMSKRMYRFFSAFFFMFTFGLPMLAAAGTDAPATQAVTPGHYFTARYFHGSFRCPTCLQIESLSAEAVKHHFENELKSGKLVWAAVNVDEPDNRHFRADYQLYSWSLIISEVRDGKEVRWKNLEKVWKLVRNEEEFDRYVASEIKAWMGL